MTTVVTERRSAGHSWLSSSVLLPPRQSSARSGSAAILYDKLYTFGGFDTDSRADAAAYDPATSAWSTPAPLPFAMYQGAATGGYASKARTRRFSLRRARARCAACGATMRCTRWSRPPPPSPARFALHDSALSSIWTRFWI